MLKFDKTLEQVIQEQATTTRASSFTEYNSKKKLLESGKLEEKQMEFIKQLKNTFTFYLHNDARFLVVTMYYSTTKTYGFLVVDLATMLVAQSESVKTAKQAVLAHITQEQDTVEEAQAETTEESENK